MERQNNYKIEPNWLTRKTGDPFVDTGGHVIQFLQEEFPEENIFSIIERVTRIYVRNWGASIHEFFLNSKITQTQFDADKKIEENLKYFKGLLEETNDFKVGYCRVLGEKTKLFPAGRDNSMLSGSGTFINFHPAFDSGLSLSKEAIIRLFFVPLGTEKVGGRIALIDSNVDEIVARKVRKVLRNNLKDIGLGIGKGVSLSIFRNPANALFEFSGDLIGKVDDSKIEKATINVYHFTNLGKNVDVELYTFPSELFRFYVGVLKYEEFRKDWDPFIKSHYRSNKHKNTKYNLDNGRMIFLDKKQETSLPFEGKEGFQTWYNPVYDNLLKGKTLRHFFLKWIRDKKKPLDFNIIKLYQIFIRKMKKETLDKIDELAEFIIDDENQIKKRIGKLDGFSAGHALRRWLITDLMRSNYSQKNPDPLFSVEDYVQLLFPDGQFWQEVRDLILIAIYQKMHQKGIWIEEMTKKD